MSHKLDYYAAVMACRHEYAEYLFVCPVYHHLLWCRRKGGGCDKLTDFLTFLWMNQGVSFIKLG